MKGICANSGIVNGVALNLENSTTVTSDQSCYIIIAKSFTPDILMKYKSVIGFVTENGGVTCHAAILARMMNIPCIVGVKNATQIIHDSQWIRICGDKIGEIGEVVILNGR